MNEKPAPTTGATGGGVTAQTQTGKTWADVAARKSKVLSPPAGVPLGPGSGTGAPAAHHQAAPGAAVATKSGEELNTKEAQPITTGDYSVGNAQDGSVGGSDAQQLPAFMAHQSALSPATTDMVRERGNPSGSVLSSSSSTSLFGWQSLHSEANELKAAASNVSALRNSTLTASPLSASTTNTGLYSAFSANLEDGTAFEPSATTSSAFEANPHASERGESNRAAELSSRNAEQQTLRPTSDASGTMDALGKASAQQQSSGATANKPLASATPAPLLNAKHQYAMHRVDSDASVDDLIFRESRKMRPVGSSSNLIKDDMDLRDSPRDNEMLDSFTLRERFAEDDIILPESPRLRHDARRRAFQGHHPSLIASSLIRPNDVAASQTGPGAAQGSGLVSTGLGGGAGGGGGGGGASANANASNMQGFSSASSNYNAAQVQMLWSDMNKMSMRESDQLSAANMQNPSGPFRNSGMSGLNAGGGMSSALNPSMANVGMAPSGDIAANRFAGNSNKGSGPNSVLRTSNTQWGTLAPQSSPSMGQGNNQGGMNYSNNPFSGSSINRNMFGFSPSNANDLSDTAAALRGDMDSNSFASNPSSSRHASANPMMGGGQRMAGGNAGLGSNMGGMSEMSGLRNNMPPVGSPTYGMNTNSFNSMYGGNSNAPYMQNSMSNGQGGMYNSASGQNAAQMMAGFMSAGSNGNALLAATNGNNMVKFSSFSEVTGRIVELARDQHGCRFLQTKLEEGQSYVINTIFEEVFESFVDLMTDPFGNYLCQKLFEHCSDAQRLALVRKCGPALARVSANMHGTRAVQRMVECLSTQEQVTAVIRALIPSAVFLMKDVNGNHVIQRCLHRMNATNNQFVYDAVAANCFELATHRHGCCVMQRCMDYASAYQRDQVVQEVTQNALPLVQNAFGNYVVQYVLDLAEPAYTLLIIQQLKGNLSELSTQKFSSNVIEKCLEQAPPEIRAILIAELIADPEIIGRLLFDAYGNYVIQRALSVCQSPQLEQLCEAIYPHLPALRSSPYGKRIQTKIMKRMPKNIQQAPGNLAAQALQGMGGNQLSPPSGIESMHHPVSAHHQLMAQNMAQNPLYSGLPGGHNPFGQGYGQGVNQGMVGQGMYLSQPGGMSGMSGMSMHMNGLTSSAGPIGMPRSSPPPEYH
mmetsp:Transcript_11391/g.19493  ORF Transcript_11391/g.19493 Transcript_11391/m.19493 type:complete len:1155 (-) Transcript_11391:68-3532(-)